MDMSDASKAQPPTDRGQRRREDAVRRLVLDVTRVPRSSHSSESNALNVLSTSTNTHEIKIDAGNRADPVLGAAQPSRIDGGSGLSSFAKLPDEALLTSAVAVSIERGIDRELHNELVRQARESAGVISKICHDHSDAFLGSVGRVVALGVPCGELRGKVEEVSDMACAFVDFLIK